MEVAGHWRRQWAGTAEYGKVTEGGVTRHMARAMEVVNASAPGARMRVVRAAYHSTAGHGAPASSYLMHSSRTVLSSGFNLLESPTYPSIPSKPLEISSMPLESSPEPNTDTENYKVTEPDDFEISEPSKWKSSSNRNSLRMPSEESSSTDNASVIDLDSRMNLLRKYSYDSENSDIPSFRRNSSRDSPLLDPPVALSTLKYKSLLNGNSDWNSRRKSYSFEDTSPLNETVVHSNDTLAMESSTDSGICKSTEIVNDADDKFYDKIERRFDRHEETFKDWLSKNRSNSSFYKGKPTKSSREHGIVIEEPLENTIALQSKGKVSITVPITVADDYEYKKTNASDDADRKVKKVEFCKTELHFTTDTGKVNIIATDEKPPPSNDFRKRRSAFVPINGKFEKPITLFGESTKEFSVIEAGSFTNTTNEINEFEENTAATKSILKNKIPKPKPYLLGENMAFGCSDDATNKSRDSTFDSPVPSAVSLINRQLLERIGSDDNAPMFSIDRTSNFLNKASRTTSTSPQPSDSLKQRRKMFETATENATKPREMNSSSAVKIKLRSIPLSPVDSRAKTRQLRDTELTYFGVNKNLTTFNESKKKDHTKSMSASSSIDDLFQSVSLVRRASNSVCNSEAESEDSPEYQNIPLKTNFAPIPTPRTRSKYDTENGETKVLKPVIEQEDESSVYSKETRRSRLRRQEETSAANRSISEPPKRGAVVKSHRREDQSRENKYSSAGQNSIEKKKVLTVKKHPNIDITEEEEPMYVNYGIKPEPNSQLNNSFRRKANKSPNKMPSFTKEKEIKTDSIKARRRIFEKENKDKISEKTHRVDVDIVSTAEQKPTRKVRTEKLATPDYSNEKYTNDKIYDKSSKQLKLSNEVNTGEDSSLRSTKVEHRSRSSQRNKIKPEDVPLEEKMKFHDVKAAHHKGNIVNGDTKYNSRTSSQDKSAKRESSNTRKHVDSSNDNYRNSTKSSKSKEISISDKVPSSKDAYKTSRSAYVINYDDKNGTVSSVCKVKPGFTSSRKKPKEKTKEKEYRNKPEKNALLQYPDEVSPYADRKWKRKMHVQRSCQLL
ncbi:hypothetical protein O0L34_g7179 [Tuta absoluta]|nr:hypothetical protein O0L34_g7179 [Tuta absoluta]